ncbi:Nif3-like dinuclear metal center hexameric protein [Anaerobium acetethylicum]|uniref:GTP cyclohydrolase 1 type 2 homolog n=1 Tax=Anaerobium acetethylicum TaxID=1619234 RepID=A0A1D3TS38_9FIRM|nr:Nif3-like dinuclear metal center hexameric protein [Anaerobium acetethylicum]SCP96596.1 dinuclear metal center protein, YbgI/SA1388 family [Anaerobium acetethylicum]
MNCGNIIKNLEQLAPLRYAESWDNPGLLAGRRDKEVRKVFVALDATDHIIDQAIRQGADMLITHHPLIFKGISQINDDEATGRRLIRLIQNDISYYAMHTNYDVCVMADLAAGYLGMTDRHILETTYEAKYLKIAVYVPDEYADRVREAMLGAGAGHVGNYSHCSYNIKGTGTFIPLEGTNPFSGEIGSLARTSEVKIETIVQRDLVGKVVKAMKEAHPYEEVAYDIYELCLDGEKAGIGRTGILPYRMTLGQCCQFVKDKFDLEHVKVFGDLDSWVSMAAISPGSGKSMIRPALKSGVQVLITGDIGHHEGIDAVSDGLAVIDAGHYGLEHIFVLQMKDYLEKVFEDLEIVREEITQPFSIV